ncbi:MAG: tetratricopeptide repeat protein [Candidatus Xenobia bacterium]
MRKLFSLSILIALGLVVAAGQVPWQRQGALIELGDREYYLKHLDRAERLYCRVSQHSDWRGWQRLGWLHALMGKDALAYEDYRWALVLNPGDSRTLLQMFGVALRRRQFEVARDCLRRVMRQWPPSIEAHRDMALLEIAQGHPDKAAAWLRRGLEINPYHPWCNLDLAHLMEQAGNWEGAHLHYAAAVGLNGPFDAQASYHDGIALLHLNRPREAMLQFRQATDCDAGMADAWYLRGVLERDLDPPQARASLQRFLALQPDGTEAQQARRWLSEMR